jgi:ATP-binding cassette subfamily B (MDR/TAP) protein 1
LQEVNKESEQAADNQNKSEITSESFRQSSLRNSQRTSFLRSLSRGSSLNSTSGRSFSLTAFGLPTDVPPIHDNEVAKPVENFPKVSIRRLAYLNKPEIPFLLLGAIAAMINGAILPIFGILLSRVIKSFFEPPHQLRKDTNFWAIMFVILGVVSFLSIPARAYLLSVAGCRLIERIRVMCFEKLVRMEIGWFDEPEHSSGSIGARLSADAATVRALVGDALGQMLHVIASAVAGLVIAFVASWQLAFIVLALIPLIGINGYVQIKFMKGFGEDAKVCFKTNNLFFFFVCHSSMLYTNIFQAKNVGKLSS